MIDKKPITGEIVDPKVIRQKTPATLQEIKFAKLVAQGEDPIMATRMVSTVGRMAEEGNKALAVKEKTVELLRKCQDKMILDLTTMAPKGLKKLEDLLEAKDPVFFKGEKVAEKANRNVQLQAAKALVDLVKPNEKTQAPSLVGTVITIVNE